MRLCAHGVGDAEVRLSPVRVDARGSRAYVSRDFSRKRGNTATPQSDLRSAAQ